LKSRAAEGGGGEREGGAAIRATPGQKKHNYLKARRTGGEWGNLNIVPSREDRKPAGAPPEKKRRSSNGRKSASVKESTKRGT